MKFFTLAASLFVVGMTLGCSNTTTTEKKAVITTDTPNGHKETTIHQKVETSPDSATRTTTEKVETRP